MQRNHRKVFENDRYLENYLTNFTRENKFHLLKKNILRKIKQESWLVERRTIGIMIAPSFKGTEVCLLLKFGSGEDFMAFV